MRRLFQMDNTILIGSGVWSDTKKAIKWLTKASATEHQPVVISHIRWQLEAKKERTNGIERKTIINFATLTRKRQPL